MNHSFYSADRMTHLKIVVVALFAAVIVSGIVALTLSPMLSAHLIHAQGKESWLTRQVRVVARRSGRRG